MVPAKVVRNNVIIFYTYKFYLGDLAFVAIQSSYIATL